MKIQNIVSTSARHAWLERRNLEGTGRLWRLISSISWFLISMLIFMGGALIAWAIIVKILEILILK